MFVKLMYLENFKSKKCKNYEKNHFIIANFYIDKYYFICTISKNHA